MFKFTPMTPVEATRACDSSQSAAAAERTAISRASAIPCGPVHAFAQPLFVTMTCAMPPLASRCARDTSTGAAFAWFVVNTAAAVAGRSAAISARSGWPESLMPHATPALRNPYGAVIPPPIGMTSATVDSLERENDSMLPTSSEKGALATIASDLFGD